MGGERPAQGEGCGRAGSREGLLRKGGSKVIEGEVTMCKNNGGITMLLWCIVLPLSINPRDPAAA